MPFFSSVEANSSLADSPLIARSEPLGRLIDTTWHLLHPKGSLLAIKGESASEELASTELKKGTKS
ncbi:MAG: hypothetical protein ACKO5V_06465, partial [Actinomycetota bacterium]